MAKQITGRDGADYRMTDKGAVLASTSGQAWESVYNKYGAPMRAIDEESFALLVEAHIERNERHARDMGFAV